MAMNLSLKKQWTEALRSGNFKQTKSFLKLNDEYCCLGVLCTFNKIFNSSLEEGSFDEDEIEEFKNWSGLNDFHIEELVNLNDTQNYSFNQIADYIEENL